MLVSVISALFGVVLMGSGLWHFMQAWTIRRAGVRCDGVVVGSERDRWGAAFPVVEFVTVDGHRLRFTSKAHWPALALPRHRRVAVRYSATNKALAVIDTFVGTWGKGIGSLLLGAALLVVALVASP